MVLGQSSKGQKSNNIRGTSLSRKSGKGRIYWLSIPVIPSQQKSLGVNVVLGTPLYLTKHTLNAHAGEPTGSTRPFGFTSLEPEK